MKLKIKNLDNLENFFSSSAYFEMTKPVINNLNVLLQPTESCNMKCKYCFDKKAQLMFKNKKLLNFLSLQDYESIVNKLNTSQRHVSITFHGGEPLLWGYNNIKEQIKITARYPNVTLRSIQSNLTLLTKEIAKLCSENNVQISTSFDFYGNDYSRGNTDKIISNIKLLQQYQKNVSAILVINKFNYEHLVDSYIQQNNLKLSSLSFNSLQNTFTDKLGINYNNQEVQLKSYFLYYITHDGIVERSINDSIKKLCNPSSNGVCSTTGKCIMQWIGIFPNQDVCNGDFYYDNNQYIYGNLKYAQTIQEVMQFGNFKNYQNEMQHRKQECLKNKCPLYLYCKGGCNWRHYVYSGKISKVNPNYCLFTLIYYKWLIEVILSQNNSYKFRSDLQSELNYIIKNKSSFKELVSNIDFYINDKLSDFVYKISQEDDK